MARRNRTPEENARREKIRELLQMANIGSMEDIQSLFKETIAEFMENGLEAELDDELGYSRYDYKNKGTDNSRNGHSSKTLRTSFGDVEVSVPRDRKGEFDPKVLKKNQTSKASKRDIETSNQRLINDDENHRCVSYEGEITFDNYLRIDNSDMEPDEAARLIKETFNL